MLLVLKGRETETYRSYKTQNKYFEYNDILQLLKNGF